MTGHVTESIFDGKTHIIPLADVSHCQHIKAVPAYEVSLGNPKAPKRLRVFLKSSTPHSPAILLEGAEIKKFSADWCRYRSELEKDTLYPMHAVEVSTPEEGDFPIERLRQILKNLELAERQNCGEAQTPVGQMIRLVKMAIRTAQKPASGRITQPEAPLAIDDMVSRFLSWRLPDDFHPDCGIRFAPLNHPNSWPIGTNLFTATQAKAMLEHALAVTAKTGA